MKKNGFRGAWTFLRVPKIIEMTRFCLLYLGRPLAHHWCPSLFFNNENVYKFAPKWNHGLKLIPKSNPKSTFRTLARHAKRLQSPHTLLEGKAWRARSTALLWFVLEFVSRKSYSAQSAFSGMVSSLCHGLFHFFSGARKITNKCCPLKSHATNLKKRFCLFCSHYKEQRPSKCPDAVFLVFDPLQDAPNLTNHAQTLHLSVCQK